MKGERGRKEEKTDEQMMQYSQAPLLSYRRLHLIRLLPNLSLSLYVPIFLFPFPISPFSFPLSLPLFRLPFSSVSQSPFTSLFLSPFLSSFLFLLAFPSSYPRLLIPLPLNFPLPFPLSLFLFPCHISLSTFPLLFPLPYSSLSSPFLSLFLFSFSVPLPLPLFIFLSSLSSFSPYPVPLSSPLSRSLPLASPLLLLRLPFPSSKLSFRLSLVSEAAGDIQTAQRLV